MSWQDQYDLYGSTMGTTPGTTPGTTGGSTMAMGGNEKMENDLSTSIKKALTTDETAPKQKHVRAIIIYTWECKSSGSFWTALHSYPMIGDDIVQYKALILFHKIIRQGHPTVLKDAYTQSSWLDSIVRNTNDYSSGPTGGSSYMPMIKAYTQYLKQKLDYHNLRPFFSGTFDYEEYVSLMGVQDPNEGYETISELLGLLDKLAHFVKVVFANVRSYGANECRIAALVPLVEESHGIYKFIVAMMTAMHLIIGSVEVLALLRDQFKAHHYALVKFYAECSQIRYLTSLISIPQLGTDAPGFLDQGPPQQPPRKVGQVSEEAYMRKQDRIQEEARKMQEMLMERQRREDAEMREQQKVYQMQQMQQQELEARQRQEALEARERQRQEETNRMQQQQQQFLQMQNVNQQLEWYRMQNVRDREVLGQYESQVAMLTNEMGLLRVNAEAGSKAKELENEINQWKQKYEALAKLYAQLRKEHLDLLQKFKALKDSSGKGAEETRKKLEQVEGLLKTKTSEMSDVLVDRTRLHTETDHLRQHILHLQTELHQAHQTLTDLSLTKGSEVQALVARFAHDQAALETRVSASQAETARLSGLLADSVRECGLARDGFEEEKRVLQMGLDQALEMLKMHQDESQSGLGMRDERIAVLEGKHRDLLFQMMDNVLETCMTTVQESVYVLEASEESRSTISPHFVLVLVEKAAQKCTDFSSAFVRLVNGGDPKEAVVACAAFAQIVAQVLRNGKEMERLVPVDSEDDIIEILKATGTSTLNFFNSVKSQPVSKVEASKRAEYIVNLGRQTQFQISATSEILDRLAASYSTATSKSQLDGDLTTAVEREMGIAAKAIEEASKRLHALLASGGDLNVHSAILQAAVALTTAIQHLIQCATASQNEIVALNKGGQTTTAYYKKNHKWTEGLISAAHSVATSTVHLVSRADGLVQGTQSWEQVVVAAQDVGVCTTQLVAAARVKAATYSKTQEALEKAAVGVREASKLVVKAAKEASAVSGEKEALRQVGKMSGHEAKVREMEQQVAILELEKALTTARFTLGEIRKQQYHAP